MPDDRQRGPEPDTMTRSKVSQPNTSPEPRRRAPRTALEADELRIRLTARIIELRCKPEHCADGRCRRRGKCRQAEQKWRQARKAAQQGAEQRQAIEGREAKPG